MNTSCFFASCLIFLALIGCGGREYAVSDYLNSEEEESLKYELIRYLGKLPKKANHQNKFDGQFDAYYKTLAQEHILEHYFIDESGMHYFLISRVAPSLHVRRVATGGKFSRTEDGTIDYYEETFRTWKMPVEELQEKGAMLFDKMVKNEDLSPYFTINSGDDFYIQFPDGLVYYDAEERLWKTRNE